MNEESFLSKWDQSQSDENKLNFWLKEKIYVIPFVPRQNCALDTLSLIPPAWEKNSYSSPSFVTMLNIELDNKFTWRFHFLNWSYFQTNLFFPPVCLGPSWQPYALDMVSKLWLPSRHFQITLFLWPNPKTIEIITMAVFFATKSNFSPSLLLPSSQMGWHCYQLAPFHWILIRRKEDLSFCLQGYRINMNIGSSDRLGKTCRPCKPFVATAF